MTGLLPPSRGLEWWGPLALRSHLCSLALPLPRSTPLPRLSVIHDRALARLGALPGAAPTLTLPGPPCHVTGSLGNGDVVPAHSLVGRMPGLASRSLASRPVRGILDECALARALHTPPLPVCSLGGPSRGLQTTPGAVGFAHALGVAVRGLDGSARALRAAAGPAVIVCDHTVPGIGPVTVHGDGTGHSSPLTGMR